MKRRALRIFGLLALGVTLAWVTGLFDSTISDEDQIRSLIEQIANGAESADIQAVMAPISEHYSDDEGMGRREIYGLFWSQFRKRGPITVWLSAIDVRVQGVTATADFDAGLAEGTEGELIGWPVNVDALTFKVQLERDEGTWFIISHHRQPAWELDHQP